MSFINYFVRKAREGNVDINDVRDLLNVLEFNEAEKKIVSTKTGVMRGRFYSVMGIKYWYEDCEFDMIIVMVDRIGITTCKGKVSYNDVDDTTVVLEWEVE